MTNIVYTSITQTYNTASGY